MRRNALKSTPYLFIVLACTLLQVSCSHTGKPGDELPPATVEGTLSRNGSAFEGIIHLEERHGHSGSVVRMQDEVTIYTRPGYIRREVKTEDKRAPVVGMIYKAGDSLVTIYGISTKNNARRHYRLSVDSFNQEKLDAPLYMHPGHNASYAYIRPYSHVFGKAGSNAGLMKDSVYNGKMGMLSLKASYYYLHDLSYCRAIWSPEITIDTALVRMTEVYMPPELPTLALYVNYYPMQEKASDGKLDKLLKKANKLLPANKDQAVMKRADAHALSDADFQPPAGSTAVAGADAFSAEIGNYREQTRTEISPDHGHRRGHHHH